MQDEESWDEKTEELLDLLKPIGDQPARLKKPLNDAEKEHRRKMMTEDEIRIRRALLSPRLPKLVVLPPNVVVAAESHPGFSSDLSSWILTIDISGCLQQHFLGEASKTDKTWKLQESFVAIGADKVEQLVKLATELDFPNFQYTSMCATDMGSCRISLRIGEQVETVVDNSSPSFMPESEERFYRLWRAITRHAPFPKR